MKRLQGNGCRLCVSIAAADIESLARVLVRAAAADLVEARLDALLDPVGCDEEALAGLVRRSPVPLGFTCRPSWEGGAFAGPESERRALLQRAAEAGGAFVDIEQDAVWAEAFLAASPVPVILSHHWQKPSPDDLDERAARMASLAPAVAKLVAPAQNPAQALPLLWAGKKLVEGGQASVAFCLGEAGRFSRLLAASYGAALTYAALPDRQPVAVGQWPLAVLLEEFRLRRWRQGWSCCGLVGHPLGLSLSAAIFNAAFDAAGLPFGYLPLAFPQLGPVLEVAEAWGFRGLSVTMPFKEEAAGRCVELDPLAQAVGAVNTLVATPRGWAGHNTDAGAVAEALSSVVELAGSRVAIVGAGGVARAAAVALAEADAAVTVLNRRRQRAARVAALVGGDAGPIEELEGGSYEVVINATPVGMQGAGAARETPFQPDWLRGDEVVFDLVYRPRQTPLLRAARQRGCVTLDGLEMFLRQAAAQYRLWTGSEAPVDTMRAVAESAHAEEETADGRRRSE
ncbi:MAG: shikimate dehydrogenase [Acidobacteriota bacterium]